MLCLRNGVHLSLCRLGDLRDGLRDVLRRQRRLLGRARERPRGVGDRLRRLLDGLGHAADVLKHLVRLICHLSELIARVRRQMDAEVALRHLAQGTEYHVHRGGDGAQENEPADTSQEDGGDGDDNRGHDDAIICGIALRICLLRPLDGACLILHHQLGEGAILLACRTLDVRQDCRCISGILQRRKPLCRLQICLPCLALVLHDPTNLLRLVR